MPTANIGSILKTSLFTDIDVIDVYYVGGFGVMGWVSASDYDRSRPDPLADDMAEIIQHMNADHKDALVMRGARIAFLTEVSNPAETRKVLVEMV